MKTNKFELNDPDSGIKSIVNFLYHIHLDAMSNDFGRLIPSLHIATVERPTILFHITRHLVGISPQYFVVPRIAGNFISNSLRTKAPTTAINSI